MHSRHQRKTTGNQIRSSKTSVFCIPSPPRAGNEVTFACSTVFQNSTSASTLLQGRCHCWRCQCGSIQILPKSSSTKICTILRLLLCWERCNVRSTRDAHLKADFILILTPIITFLNLAQQVILICCFMAILSGGKPPGPRIMREFWSNSRERIQGKREQTRWGQLFRQRYWSLCEEDGWKGLSWPRESRQFHDCTSRLWCSSIRTRLEAPKQRSYDNNVCSRRYMHSMSLASDVNVGENIMFVLGSYDHFSHSVLPSFFSQLCDPVVIKTDWCSQNERMVQRISWQKWRSLFSLFKSREWRCCWDEKIVIPETRVYRKWWRRARDRKRRLHFLHLHKLVSFFFLELLRCKRA